MRAGVQLRSTRLRRLRTELAKFQCCISTETVDVYIPNRIYVLFFDEMRFFCLIAICLAYWYCFMNGVLFPCLFLLGHCFPIMCSKTNCSLPLSYTVVYSAYNAVYSEVLCNGWHGLLLMLYRTYIVIKIHLFSWFLKIHLVHLV